MATNIVQMTDGTGNKQYPVTSAEAVGMPDGSGNLTNYLDKRVTEYNVSVLHPTSGSGGSNKYTLETAIAQVPSKYRSVGLKCAFINTSGSNETWEYKAGSWNVSGFVQVGSAKLTELNENKIFGFNNNPIISELDDTNSLIASEHKIVSNYIKYKGGFLSFIYVKSKVKGTTEIYTFNELEGVIQNLTSIGTFNINEGGNILILEKPIEIKANSLVGIKNLNGGIYGTSTSSSFSKNIDFISFDESGQNVRKISNYAIVFSAYVLDIDTASCFSYLNNLPNQLSKDILSIKGYTNISEYENIQFSNNTSDYYLRGFNKVPSLINGYIYGFRVGLILNKPDDKPIIIPYTCDYDGSMVSNYEEFEKIEQKYIDDKSFYILDNPIPIKKGQYFGLKISNAKNIKWANNSLINTGFIIPNSDGNGAPTNVLSNGVFQEDYIAFESVIPSYRQLLQLCSDVKNINNVTETILSEQNTVKGNIDDIKYYISEGERGEEEFKHYDISQYPLINTIKNDRFYGGKLTEYNCMLSKIEYQSDNEGTLDIVVVSVNYESMKFEVLHRYESKKFIVGSNTFDFSEDNFIIPRGSIIAFRNSNTYYFTINPSDMPYGFRFDGNLLNVNSGDFINERLALKYQIYFNTIVLKPIKSSELKYDIEELKKTSDNFNYVPIYSKVFTDKEGWNNIGVDETYTEWRSDGSSIYPTSKGGYHVDSSSERSMKAGIGLWNIYSADKKFSTFDVTLYSDTVLNIHFFRDVNTGNRPNESTYRINCKGNQLQALKLDGRTVTEEVLYSSEISKQITDGKKYRVVTRKDNVTFSIELWDLTTGEEISKLLFKGWNCGTQQWCYGFSWKDGINPPKIHNFAVYEPKEPFCIYSGDSITEGSGMTNDMENRYAELARKSSKNSVICAAGSALIDDVLSMFNSEFSKTKPKNLCVTIGTNNAGSEESLLSKYQEIKQKADEIGTNLILNHIPIMVSNPTGCVRRNNEISQIGVDSCRFDLATSINNDPSQGGNSSLYTDGTHPNYGGSIAMSNRMKLDVPYLFSH